MAQVDDELALRTVLADMTDRQPPAPPNRYGAARRRAVLHRRRQLAAAAAAVVILVAVAIAIPLGLLRIGPPAPLAPRRHYHVTLVRPRPGSPSGLIASGRLEGMRWTAVVQLKSGNQLCQSTSLGAPNGAESTCVPWPPPPVTRSGDPVSNFGGGPGVQIDIGNVRSDVAYLTFTYNNGQVLTAHPVPLFGSRYARWFALPAPYSAAVTRITAYSRTGELAYAIPFTGGNTGLTISRWLQPGQPALPRPATYTIGSGTVAGSRWDDHVYVGPWGTCFTFPTGAFNCFAQTGWLLAPSATAGQIGRAHEGHVAYVHCQARPSVRYLILTTAHGRTSRVRTVRAGSRRFYAFASLDNDPVVRWVAYDSAGQELASGSSSG
jgi:hypothetical protein